MGLGKILEQNEGLYVLAKVKRRKLGKAVGFKVILASVSYDIICKEAGKEQYEGEDIIIIPPFGSQDIAPAVTAQFYRVYYGTGNVAV